MAPTVEQLVAELVAKGMDPAEARRCAEEMAREYDVVEVEEEDGEQDARSATVEAHGRRGEARWCRYFADATALLAWSLRTGATIDGMRVLRAGGQR
jgi:hypothetical protein